MQDVDVIIIGAGPAGCAAAYDLAAEGLRVVLLDKSTFPRLKPCAGGLTVKAAKALRFPIVPLIQRTCNACAVSYKGKHPKLLQAASPVVFMTVRSELDAYHLEQCRQQGADFHVVDSELSIKRTTNGWSVTSESHAYLATHLIGADGAHSRVRKTFDLFPQLNMGFAVETTLPFSAPESVDMTLDFGVVDQGYGWIFPKGDHLNIGLYSLTKIPQAKQRLTTYCLEKTGISPTNPIVGHPIPLNGYKYTHTPGDPLLVGDAAGLIDPLLGEGLYNAIRSGQLAAQSILENIPYTALIKEITRDLRSYRFDTRLFYAHPKIGARSLQAAPIGYMMMKGYALGKPIRWLKHRFPIVPFLSLPPS